MEAIALSACNGPSQLLPSSPCRPTPLRTPARGRMIQNLFSSNHRVGYEGMSICLSPGLPNHSYRFGTLAVWHCLVLECKLGLPAVNTSAGRAKCFTYRAHVRAFDMWQKKGSVNDYSFDAVFPPEAGQAEVYEGTAKPHIAELLEGINVTVFAYGATGNTCT